MSPTRFHSCSGVPGPPRSLETLTDTVIRPALPTDAAAIGRWSLTLAFRQEGLGLLGASEVTREPRHGTASRASYGVPAKVALARAHGHGSTFRETGI